MSTNKAPDSEWLTLTEGLEPYERFRFIARYVLRAAVEETTRYAADARIFDAEDLAEHLTGLDRALKEDPSLSAVERSFLCSAVAEALAREQIDASCPWQAFRPRAWGGAPSANGR